MARVRPARLSWRQVRPGMRLFNPFLGNPEITAIVATSAKTRRTLGHPAAIATTRAWGFTPKQGFVKILP